MRFLLLKEIRRRAGRGLQNALDQPRDYRYFVTAQKILDYREKHGAFSSVDELDAVPGIGPKRLEQLRELVVP
jgi:hypothetical protein